MCAICRPMGEHVGLLQGQNKCRGRLDECHLGPAATCKWGLRMPSLTKLSIVCCRMSRPLRAACRASAPARNWLRYLQHKQLIADLVFLDAAGRRV